MERKRFDEVDVLRAIGIIGVIVVHILTYNLSTPLNKFFWNNLQFVVVSFVFCSGFVLAYLYENSLDSFSKTFLWYKKRLIRLLIPFWIYLVVHFSLWILFPQSFSGLGLSKSFEYFVKSAVLIGGTNYNFLPLLFVQLTILFPLFANWFKNKKILLTYLAGALFVTLIFTLFTFPYSLYRFVIWVPWSLVLIFAMYLSIKGKQDKAQSVTNKRYLLTGVFTFVIFLLLYILNLDSNKSLNFYDHKYPPDFYYLVFGISLTCFALLIGKLKFWQNKLVKNIYSYISKNSYSIFFVHYIILDAVLVLSKQNVFLQNPFMQFVIIFFPTIFIIKSIQKFSLVFKPR